LSDPIAVTVDAAGNVYFADEGFDAVFKLDPDGCLTVAAGNGFFGVSGDNGSATSAELAVPWGVAADGLGNLYIADYFGARVRKVDANGVITTVAGDGTNAYVGDGGPATKAWVNFPQGLAVDTAGNLYIADTMNYRVRKVTLATGIITTVAGDGNGGYTGDGGLATKAELYQPYAVAVDAAGNLYIADTGNEVIRKVDINGIITTVAGGGSQYPGDGGPATSTYISAVGVAADTAGNFYIADTDDNSIRKVDAKGIITTVAGGGTQGLGDGGAANGAELAGPYGVAVDAAGNLYIADTSDQRIRKVAANGIICTVAGNRAWGDAGDGGPASGAQLYGPEGVATDASGGLYIGDIGNARVRKVAANGMIATAAGNGISGYSGDGGPAAGAQLSAPDAVAVDAFGNVYICDSGNARVRKVDTSGNITTVAGNGSAGYSGDGNPATSAQLNQPRGVAADSAGNLYIADSDNYCIRKVDSLGTITTFAGTGKYGYSGDGGLATSAQIGYPFGLALDAAGDLYIADADNHRIRKVDTSGKITTVAGGGNSGDGNPATSALLSHPTGVAVDAAGDIFIADEWMYNVRMVDTNGIIWTAAGNGTQGYSGDGGAAVSAQLNYPYGLAVDASGNVFVADSNNHAVRRLTPAGGAEPVLMIAGTHTGVFTAGESGAYTLTVGNAASAAPTSGTVTVTDFTTMGLMLASMSGDGWSCGANSCSRSDSLGGGLSYPPIAVAVAVSPAAPPQATNEANVSGGGSGGAGSRDLTEILTSSIPPLGARIGTYNAGQWQLDVNGNGVWDGAPPDLNLSLGWAGATYVTGDWNGDGRTKAGIFYNGYWFLDYDGNGVWDGGVVDKQYIFGWADPNVIPVVGDWNGDGRAKIGVYYQGFWYLDYNGNGVWDGPSVDKAYNFGWAATGVTPMVGDWAGTGTSKIGVYYQGFWYLDFIGNGIWDGGVQDKQYIFGWPDPAVTPVLGDWNGDKRAKIGIYYNGFWFLDYDGNGIWDGGVQDKQYIFGWPDPAVTPVLGDWSGDGMAKIGIFYNGDWYLDYNGNGTWDGPATDRAYLFGQSGDTAIIGAW
jgi:uncharacterized protein YjiK